MEIKSINAISAYKANMTERNTKKNTISSDKTSKRDIAEFSNKSGSTENIRNYAAKAADNGASAERISALKKSVSDGTYSIPPEVIVKSMLEG